MSSRIRTQYCIIWRAPGMGWWHAKRVDSDIDRRFPTLAAAQEWVECIEAGIRCALAAETVGAGR